MANRDEYRTVALEAREHLQAAFTLLKQHPLYSWLDEHQLVPVDAALILIDEATVHVNSVIGGLVQEYDLLIDLVEEEKGLPE